MFNTKGVNQKWLAKLLLCLVFLFGFGVQALAQRVLIITSDSHSTERKLQDMSDKILAALPANSTVDTFEAWLATPSLTQIQGYDSVLVYSNSVFSDPVAMGSVLADYVDDGGGVVQMAMSFHVNDSGLKGNWQKGNYGVWKPATSASVSGLTLSTIYDRHHPIMQGVNSFNGGTSSYHQLVGALNPGASTIALYDLYNDKATPLVGSNIGTFNGCVAGLNFFPPSSSVLSNYWVASTDGGLLMANALKYCARGFRVSRSSPVDGAIGQFINRSIELTFNKVVDIASINASTITVKDASGGLVAASLSIDSDLRTVTVIPDNFLLTSTTYTVSVNGVTAESGVVTTEPYSLSFTTSISNTLPEIENVLIITADGYRAVDKYNDIRDKILAALLVGTVDFFDARFATPSLARLQDYDSVLVYGNGGFSDQVAMGDVLADYVDSGGGVVQNAFSFHATSVNGLQGRWQTGNYGVWKPASANASGVNLTIDLTDGAYDKGHPIMQGVSSFNGGSSSYHQLVGGLNPGASTIALYKDIALPLIGSNIGTFNGCVTGLNFFPPSSSVLSNYWVASTDGGLIMANALKYCATPIGFKVMETSPGADAFNVSLDSAATIRFNNQVDALSVNSNTITLKTASGTVVPASLGLDLSLKIVTLTPDTLLLNDTQYTVFINGVTDLAGASLASPYSFSFSTPDTTAPLNPENVTFDSADTSILMRWEESVSLDIAGYKISLDGVEVADVAKGTTQYNFTGLSPASVYQVSISAYDFSGLYAVAELFNMSTLYDNPLITSTVSLAGKVTLNWGAILPDDGIAAYRIYVKQSDFTSTAGMSPALEVPKTALSATIAQLTNQTLYYFAVASVNISGGEKPAVITASETPNDDFVGPTLTTPLWDSSPLTANLVIGANGVATISATDDSGVSRVEFYFNGVLIQTDFGSAGVYSAPIDISAFVDGAYTLGFKAFDTLDQVTELSIPVQIVLAAPVAPTISSPVTGLTTNQSSIVVSGVAYGDEYQVLNNTLAATAWTPLSNDQFSVSIDLAAGLNSLTLKSRNRGGESVLSNAVAVTVDLSVPQAPTGLAATPKPAGEIVLSWSASAGDDVAGYDIYRSSSEFVDIATATRINNVHLTTTSFTDLPVNDGIYYYRVIALNSLETPSLLSNQVAVAADSEAPYAVITYEALGQYDAGTGLYGRGDINVTLTLNEPLLTTPFLSIKPGSGSVIPMSLQKQSDTVYTSVLTINDASQSGASITTFSARDAIGNQGTEILQGASIVVDAKGPYVLSLVTDPLNPVKNDSAAPVTVNIQITLDEAIKPGLSPQLSYLLSGTGRVDTPINNLVQVSEFVWSGSTTLLSDAGQLEVETLNFSYSGNDHFNNVGTEIVNATPIQVYQGDLPPYAAPFQLSGHALPGGVVELTWTEVTEADDYQLYRQAPGELELTPFVRPGLLTTYSDATLADGDYIYAVASVRVDNATEAVSALSASVTITADSLVPEAPTGLALLLTPVGVQLTWTGSTSVDVASYSLYKANITPITSVDGLTPAIEGIPDTAEAVVDESPNATTPAYVVVAVDAAGNLSLPSNTGYLNVDLLPVSTLTVTQALEAKPVIAWTHTYSGVTGYDLYLGDKDTGLKLNTTPLTGTSYTDTGYANDDRVYTVVALDVNGVESLPRSLTLPKASVQMVAGEQLRTNLINELDFVVASQSALPISNARLHVTIADRTHLSSPFTLSAGETRTIPVVIGGYADLLSLSNFSVDLVSVPHAGEQVTITRAGQVEVLPGVLNLNIETKDFIRGGQGQARFSVENTGEVLMELITGLNNGTQDSSDIKFLLKDLDGNVLVSKSIRQLLGTNVVTLASGQTVARVNPAETFVSEWFTLDVPTAAPDNSRIVLEIKNIYRDVGKTEVVTLAGSNTSRSVLLFDTPYTGGDVVVTPAASFGDQNITISGKAIDRVSALPIANVDLKLIININGFEKVSTQRTDASGSFSYTYVPQAGEAGTYKVSVIHPDLNDRPDSGVFVISKVLLNPRNLSVTIPTNYVQNLPIKATAGDGTQLTNVRLVLRAEDQASLALPTGLDIVLPAAVNLGSKQTVSLPVQMTADATAAESGSFVLALLADDSGTQVLARATVNYQITEAQPALFYSPSLVETGVTLSSTVQETITLENRGIDVLRDVNLQLLLVTDTTISEAPDWISLDVLANAGDIAVGEKKFVSFTIRPPSNLLTGDYAFRLRVSASNHPSRDIPIFATITSDGQGGYVFKIADIYTATLDSNGNVIQGLQGATIRMQNEDVPSVEFTLTTDVLGEAFFNLIPAGNYSYWASAENHQEQHGRLQVRPGITRNESVFLDYNLINLTWTVTEVTIEDSYEITLTATYEVDVPAAVVVFEPSSISLPDMAVGDVFYGEVTLTNYGLIRGDELVFELPPTDAFFKYEFFESALPSTIEAKEVVTIPYRITSLQSLEPTLDGSGGGLYTYRTCTRVKTTYTCANGSVRTLVPSFCFAKTYGTGDGGTGSGSTTSTNSSGGWTDTYDGYIESSTTTYTPSEGGGSGLPGCGADGKDCNNKENIPGGE